MPYSRSRTAISSGTRGILPNASANNAMSAAAEKSSTTMMLRLFTLSATIPPTGESTTMGRKLPAETSPSSVGEPV
jgi:hypothetical protein